MLAKIGDRIKIMKEVLNIKTNAELERGNREDDPLLLGNGTIASWKDQPVTYTTNKLEKFLTYYRINKHWWMTGEGEILDTSPLRPDQKQVLLNLYEHTLAGLRSDIAHLRAELDTVRKERDDLKKEIAQLRRTTPADDV